MIFVVFDLSPLTYVRVLRLRKSGSNTSITTPEIPVLVLIFKPRLHDTTGCQTGCTTGLTTGCIHDTAVLSNRLSTRFDKPLTTGLTTGCIVYTNIYPVVKPV